MKIRVARTKRNEDTRAAGSNGGGERQFELRWIHCRHPAVREPDYIAVPGPQYDLDGGLKETTFQRFENNLNLPSLVSVLRFWCTGAHSPLRP